MHLISMLRKALKSLQALLLKVLYLVRFFLVAMVTQIGTFYNFGIGTLKNITATNTSIIHNMNTLTISNKIPCNFPPFFSVHCSDLSLINHQNASIFISGATSLSCHITNYGNLYASQNSSWTLNTTSIDNYHLVDFTLTKLFSVANFNQYAGIAYMYSGNLQQLSIYGGHVYLNGDMTGDIDHYSGAMSVGPPASAFVAVIKSDAGNLNLTGNYEQKSENATIEIDLFSNGFYDFIKAVNK